MVYAEITGQVYEGKQTRYEEVDGKRVKVEQTKQRLFKWYFRAADGNYYAEVRYGTSKIEKDGRIAES